MEPTISFTDPTCIGARAGGKGANLGRLTAAGFTVPSGFVVPTDAYLRFVKESGIRDELLGRVADFDADDAAGDAPHRLRSAGPRRRGAARRELRADGDVVRRRESGRWSRASPRIAISPC